MADAKRCCRNCDWCKPDGAELCWGECRAPLPSCVTAMTLVNVDRDGASCLCFVPREKEGSQ